MNPVSGPGGPQGPGDEAMSAAQERLRNAAHDLEGVFVSHLFKAMRATVPQDGILPADSGQDTFTEMFDDKIAEMSAHRSNRGLGEALYRELSRRLVTDNAAVNGTGRR